MNTKKALSILILAAFATAFAAGGEIPPAPERPLDRAIQLIGDLIPIEDNVYQSPSPAVAYSDKSNHYLVVYNRAVDNFNKDIFGYFVNAATGELTGDEIEIASSGGNEYDPDVTYDTYKDVFLVVYESETCTGEPEVCLTSIKGRLVEEPKLNGSALPEAFLGPNEFTVAVPQTTDYDFYRPQVAYNKDDHQYLVVFLRAMGGYTDTTELWGQMLLSDKETPVRLGPEKGFHITNSADFFYSLDVTWASGSSTFIVMVEMTDGKSPEEATYQQLVALWMYDTYQSGSDQLIGSWGKICPRPPLTKFCLSPAVAYDPITDSFTIVYNYDKKGENWEEMTVYGQRLTAEFKPNEEFFLGDPFPVETDLNKHGEYFSPEIAYSGPGDTMHVTYQARVNFPGFENDYYVIYLRELNGSQVGPPLTILESNKDVFLTSTPLASPLPGQSMVVWGEEIQFEYWDLFGQRVGTFNTTYLPSIFKEN